MSAIVIQRLTVSLYHKSPVLIVSKLIFTHTRTHTHTHTHTHIYIYIFLYLL